MPKATVLLSIIAVVELLAGAGLLFFPSLSTRLLFGADPVGVAIAGGRVTGIALIALGLGAAIASRSDGKKAIYAGLLAFNAGTAIYLGLLGVNGLFVGVLLWPAMALHAGLAVLLALTFA